ncbi:hypothetical protein JIN84_17025 [Luteolibacter yonseiensis]|uniref:Uncharacterized protein n=1 Tax=Luteolibacter yonseiensis TaxID=1144680 RepID=A0A934VCU1_9BACT|nr:hypothetical protein [Luteolibacter yonseiensis]MBK1817326.1 hypothetical protein [Luteolibacter yonseiensis]
MERRTIIITAVVILIVTTAVILRKSLEPTPQPKPAPTVSKEDDGTKLVTTTDPALVFQKAFWRRPAADDRILHAERREWSSQDGVKKWQWYIAVSPGPQLLAWLKTNPFSLSDVRSAGRFENRPGWFPEETHGYQIQRNAEGRFTVMLSTDGRHLYATDSGQGFTAPEIAP